MATHYIPDEARERAIRAARRKLADGDRPVFHVRFENVAQFRDDPFAWFVWVLEVPDVYATGPTPSEAVQAVASTIATRVEIPVEAFDVVEDSRLRSVS